MAWTGDQTTWTADTLFHLADGYVHTILPWTADETFTVDEDNNHTADGYYIIAVAQGSGGPDPGEGRGKLNRFRLEEDDKILMQFVEEYMKRAA